MERYEPTPNDKFTEDETRVIRACYDLTDFKLGLSLPGELRPARIPGGVILVDTPYVMRYV
jgi:hypothetical protein